MTDTQTQSPAKPLPAAADHLPVSFLNPDRGRGIATMTATVDPTILSEEA